MIISKAFRFQSCLVNSYGIFVSRICSVCRTHNPVFFPRYWLIPEFLTWATRQSHKWSRMTSATVLVRFAMTSSDHPFELLKFFYSSTFISCSKEITGFISIFHMHGQHKPMYIFLAQDKNLNRTITICRIGSFPIIN